MIKINVDPLKLKKIKKKHFKFIKENIKTQIEKDFKKIEEISNIKEAEKYFKEVHEGKELEEIKVEVGHFKEEYFDNEIKFDELISSTPDKLRNIVNKIENGYPNIHKYKFLEKMYDYFVKHKNPYEETIKAISHLIRNIEEGKLTSVSEEFKYKKKQGSRVKGDLKEVFYYNNESGFSIDNLIQSMIKEIEESEKKGHDQEDLIMILRKYKGFIYDEMMEIYNNYLNYNEDEDYLFWGAYPLVIQLNLTVCPYCNRNFIHTFYSKDGKVRAQIDHFLPKSRYPYLAVSFYNLIPCCYNCNASLKGTEEFTFDSHLNPYVRGFEDNFKFTIKPICVSKEEINWEFLMGDSSRFRIEIIEIESTNCDPQVADKIKNNVNVFKLKELYNFHKDYVCELIKKSRVYNETRIKELLELEDSKGNRLFTSKEEIIHMIISNYTNEKDLDKRILSKFVRDISKELGLLSG